MNIVLFIQKALKVIEEYLGNNTDNHYNKIRNLVISFYHNYNKKITSLVILFYCIPHDIVIFIWEVFILLN